MKHETNEKCEIKNVKPKTYTTDVIANAHMCCSGFDASFFEIEKLLQKMDSE